MIIEELSPAAYAHWDAYVEAHPLANCYHLRVWKSVAERAYRMPAPFLVARHSPDGPLCGVLPLFVARRPFGGYVTTGLFGAYGRLLCDSDAIGLALLAQAQRLATRAAVNYLIVKAQPDEPLAQRLTRSDPLIIATLPLAEPTVLWKGFRDKIRNAIRKAQRNQLELRTGSEYVADLHDVLAENMHRKGTPIYGPDFLRELISGLGDRAEILTLWHQGQIISAALVIYHKGVVRVPFASSRQASFHLNPNNLLYWEIMQRGCHRGMQLLDFGTSPQHSTTLAFKLGWGAQIVPAPYYVYQIRGQPPVMDTSSPTIERLIKLWQRLPRPVADRLGPQVCRRFLV